MNQQKNPSVSARGLWLASTNILLAIMSGLFAYAHALNFIHYQRISNLLIIANDVLHSSFFLVRRAPLQTTKKPYYWLVGIVGSFFSLLFRPVERPYDILAGDILQFVGLAIQVAAIASLNRSYGIVAANRGIKKDGLYRFVRHPLYASYLVGHTGYILNNPSVVNCLIFLFATGIQVHRLLIEERFLQQDSEYTEYMKRTRWRLIPSVF